jgi:hypothetical protein
VVRLAPPPPRNKRRKRPHTCLLFLAAVVSTTICAGAFRSRVPARHGAAGLLLRLPRQFLKGGGRHWRKTRGVCAASVPSPLHPLLSSFSIINVFLSHFSTRPKNLPPPHTHTHTLTHQEGGSRPRPQPHTLLPHSSLSLPPHPYQHTQTLSLSHQKKKNSQLFSPKHTPPRLSLSLPHNHRANRLMDSSQMTLSRCSRPMPCRHWSYVPVASFRPAAEVVNPAFWSMPTRVSLEVRESS